jgi:hypothetical protein
MLYREVPTEVFVENKGRVNHLACFIRYFVKNTEHIDSTWVVFVNRVLAERLNCFNRVLDRFGRPITYDRGHLGQGSPLPNVPSEK